MNARLLLVDDHPMMLGALRQVMEQQPGLTVVGEAATGELALKLALELTPDLVVMDIHLLAMNGLEAARQIRPDIDRAIQTYGRERIGIVLGTSTSGIDEASQSLAHYLRDKGVGPDVCVAIAAERSPQ